MVPGGDLEIWLTDLEKQMFSLLGCRQLLHSLSDLLCNMGPCGDMVGFPMLLVHKWITSLRGWDTFTHHSWPRSPPACEGKGHAQQLWATVYLTFAFYLIIEPGLSSSTSWIVELDNCTHSKSQGRWHQPELGLTNPKSLHPQAHLYT